MRVRPGTGCLSLCHAFPPAQVRLAWARHRGPHVLVIPGTSDPAHLADNIAAGALRLTPGHDLPGSYPSWQERLREVKGIYVLVDKKTGEQ